jgi:hypothetical protein
MILLIVLAVTPNVHGAGISFYDDIGRLTLLPDEYPTIDAAKVAAEQHSADRS